MVSTLRVSAGGTRTSIDRADATVSREGSSARTPSAGSLAVEISRHNGSAPRIRSDSTASVSPTAQSRNDVPASARATVSPRRACSTPVARSGTRIRHDTPSTTRWWTATNTRPARPGPKSNHTTCTITPASGRKARYALSRSAANTSGHELPVTATRRTSAEVSGICSGTSHCGCPSTTVNTERSM